ncbi:PLP-dependent aminotransferase family protein [Tistrella mobilis]|uniref:aminotransferase-like domain-containing protein n=1 Tax=Tistrella mobilis TaxID=171437 RepID=UPI0035593333
MADTPPRQPSRIDQLVELITGQITGGLLKTGERLASVRAAAGDHGVSKNTMAEVYDRLVAAGLLESRPGSGFYVTGGNRRPLPRQNPDVEAAVDVVSLLREQLDQHYEVRPGDGRPPQAWMEGSEIGRFFGRFKWPKGEAIDHGYGSSWGFLPLRERIAMLLAERGIKAGVGQVLLTYGANHGLDLIIRHHLEPGDTVFVDDPGYYPLFGKLTLAKVRIIGIRRGPEGPDLEDLAAKLAHHRPKLFFTQSQGHNPTGHGLTMGTAYGLLQAAERHGFQLVEDDAFADVMPASAPRLAALDQLNRVLYVGTFSKTFSASLRSGYVAASAPVAAALQGIKMLTVVATSDYVERFIYNFISDGHYVRHLRRLRARVGEAATTAAGALSEMGLDVATPAHAGFYLWVGLPAGTDELALARAAAERSIFLAPGQVFAPDRAPRAPAIRVNVAHAADPRFLAFMREVAAGGRG